MAHTFTELQKELALDKTYTHEGQLAHLKQWCAQNVSTDSCCTGSPEQQYAQYCALAKAYLDDFLSKVPHDYFALVPEFQGMNTIQYASLHGYDQFIKAVHSPYKELYNSQTEHKMTPLHLAAAAGNAATVKVLLSLGAVPIKVNDLDQFPIFSALSLPEKCSPELIQRKKEIFHLLAGQADFTLNAVDKSGENILHLMAALGYDDLIKEVLKTRPELATHSNQASQYPIHLAIINQQVAAVQALLAAPELDKLTDAEGKTLVHYAALYGDAAIVKACCAVLNNLNAKDEYGKTALDLAEEVGNKEAVSVILDFGQPRSNTGSRA